MHVALSCLNLFVGLNRLKKALQKVYNAQSLYYLFFQCINETSFQLDRLFAFGQLQICKTRFLKTHFLPLKNVLRKGIFLENDFWTPPPLINFVHGSDRKCLNLT